MSGYEVLGILVAIVAVIISTVSLVRTGKLQRQQIRLNELTEELSKKQLEIMAKGELANQQTHVEVALNKIGSSWQFLLTNMGTAVARNVNLELIDCPDSPLVRGDYDKKLPIHLLQPGQTVRLLASIHLGSPPNFKARISWTNQDDSDKTADYYLSI